MKTIAGCGDNQPHPGAGKGKFYLSVIHGCVYGVYLLKRAAIGRIGCLEWGVLTENLFN